MRACGEAEQKKEYDHATSLRSGSGSGVCRDLLLVLHLGDPPSNFAHGAPGVGAAELVSGRRSSFEVRRTFPTRSLQQLIP